MSKKKKIIVKDNDKNYTKNPKNDKYETSLIHDIKRFQKKSEDTRTNTNGGVGDISLDLQTIWDDENKIYTGDQWSTSFAYRSPEKRKIRPNSVNNIVFNAIQMIYSNIISSTPTMDIEQIDEDDDFYAKEEESKNVKLEEILDKENDPEMAAMQDQIKQQEKVKPIVEGLTQKDIADKLTCITKVNNRLNNFSCMWKNIVLEFLKHGQAICMITWDDDWIGGRGNKKWVGDVRLIHVQKEEFYPDPAIINLDYRLQECEFINRKFRKKLTWIKDKWKNGEYVLEEDNDRDIYQDEGSEHSQAWVIEHWHRGKPKFITDERKQELLDMAEKYKDIDEYKYKDYIAMSEGKMDGIHVCYIANDVLLDYIPYIYEHGLYPFVFKCRYKDSNNQLGFGEIRQIMVPQILFNKVDELEVDLYSRQAGGQEFYRKGSINNRQLDKIIKNSGRNGEMFEVDDINGIIPRNVYQANQTMVNFKHHKQQMIDLVSNVTPTMQGKAEFSNMPAAAISQLGSRADVKLKACIEILEDFLIEMCKLRIELFAQFYSDDRYYTIKGEQYIKSGKINNKMMTFSYIRDGKEELFIPEFDVSIRIMDEKPTDRTTIMNEAFALFDRQIYQAKHVLFALEENKLPNREQVLKDIQESIEAQQQGQQQAAEAQSQKLQHDMKMKEEELNIEKQKLIIESRDKQMQYQQSQQQQSNQPNNEIDNFLDMLKQNYPDFYNNLKKIPEEKMMEIIDQAMTIPVEELNQVLPQLNETLKNMSIDNNVEGGEQNA